MATRLKIERIVVELGSGEANIAALRTAFLLAQGFRAPLAALLPEDEELRDLAAIPFTHEISLTGQRRRLLSTPQMGAALRAQALALRAQMRQLAQEAGVALYDQDPAAPADTAPKAKAEEICAANASILAIAPPHNIIQAMRAIHILSATDNLRALLLMPAQTNLSTGHPIQKLHGPIALFVDNAAQLEQLAEFATILQDHRNTKTDLAFILSPQAPHGHDDLRTAALRLLGREDKENSQPPAFYHLFDKNEGFDLKSQAAFIAKAARDLDAPIAVMPFEKIIQKNDEEKMGKDNTPQRAPAFLLHLITRLRLPLLLVK